MRNIEIGDNKRIQIVGSPFGALHGAFEESAQIMTIFAGVKFDSDEHANYLIDVCARLQETQNQAGANTAFEAFTSDFLKNAVDGYEEHDPLRAPLLPIASSLRQRIGKQVGGRIKFQPETFLFRLCSEINHAVIRLVVSKTQVEALRTDAPAYNLSNLLVGAIINQEGGKGNPTDEIQEIGRRHIIRDQRMSWLKKALLFYFQALYSTREREVPPQTLEWHQNDVNGFRILQQAFAQQIGKIISDEGGGTEVFELIGEITNNHAYNDEVPAALWSEPTIIDALTDVTRERHSSIAESAKAPIRTKIMKMVEKSSRHQAPSQTFGKAVFDLFLAIHDSNANAPTTEYLAVWKGLLNSKMLRSLDLYWQTTVGQDTAGFSLSKALARDRGQSAHAKLIKLGQYAPPSLHNWFKKSLRNAETRWWHKHETGFLLWRWESNTKWRKWTAK